LAAKLTASGKAVLPATIEEYLSYFLVFPLLLRSSAPNACHQPQRTQPDEQQALDNILSDSWYWTQALPEIPLALPELFFEEANDCIISWGVIDGPSCG
jgi:hypothetical protein